MRRTTSIVTLVAVGLAALGVATLLLVPDAPWIGLGLGAISLTLLLAPALTRTADRSRPRGGAILTRRAVLVAGVALAFGVAELARRRWLPDAIAGMVPSPGASARPGPTPGPRPAGAGLWLSPDEIAALPIDNDAFARLRERAREPITVRDISDQESPTPEHLMQTALVAARLDDDGLRDTVRDVIVAAIGTEDGDTGGNPDRNRPLGIGRNLPGYVLAADLIGLRTHDRTADDRFRSWLDQLRGKPIPDAGATLVESEARDHSNWGGHISAAVTAANLYLGDAAASRRSADCLRGWLGDREGRRDWEYDTERHDYSWMCHYPDVARFVPVNEAGCRREGMEIGGIIPIDMQRGAGFQIPPRFTRYPRESLQARTAQAELLYRAGFDTWSWGDGGLRRIAERQRAMATAFDSEWYEPEMGCYWIIALRTGASLPLEEPSIGRSVSGVDWTHAPR